LRFAASPCRNAACTAACTAITRLERRSIASAVAFPVFNLA
jgi:hypothetical protein